MHTPVVDVAAIDRAVEVLRRGGIVALPTETVYGLAADADNEEAVRKLFAAKGRPADHPVIVHVGGADAFDEWAIEVPDAARALIGAFWPGPLTLVARRSARARDIVTGGQDTVGIRSPAHPWARTLLHEFGGALAAPSANSFGRISPTTAQHVIDDLGVKPRGKVDLDPGRRPVSGGNRVDHRRCLQRRPDAASTRCDHARSAARGTRPSDTRCRCSISTRTGPARKALRAAHTTHSDERRRAGRDAFEAWRCKDRSARALEFAAELSSRGCVSDCRGGTRRRLRALAVFVLASTRFERRRSPDRCGTPHRPAVGRDP